MAKKSKLDLQLVSAATGTQPPRALGKHGRKLWDRVMSEYDISDVGGVETLAQACQGLDRAESLRAEIDHDGEVIRTSAGIVKDHPALKHELAARSFVVRTLARLGLNFEPVRPSVGRPGNSIGWQP